MRRASLLRVFTAVACLAAASFAQVNTASLLGRVIDASGAVVPNAKLLVRNTQTGFERSVVTDENGAYDLRSLAIGPYTIEVQVPNFRKEVREGVVLAAGDRVRLDFTLQPGQVTESVTVSAAAPLVNAASPELGTVIDSRKVTDLPIAGRNFTQLVTLQPGVQSSGVNGRQSYNLNGLSQWGLNITLDGTDASFGESQSFGDPSGRSVLNTVSVDSIQEFRILAGTFTAETGRASGGAINIITKGGTNDFHGVLFEYLRNTKLDARNFFAARRDPLVQNQFGGTFGGPIVRNKLFFFGSYEGARRRVGQQIVSNVPTASLRARSPAVFQPYLAQVPLPTEPVSADVGIHRRSDQFRTDENLYNIRGDYNTGKTITTLRYSLNDSDNSIPNVIPANRQAFSIRNHLATVSNTYTISPAMLNEVRLGFNRWVVPRLNTTFFGGFGEVNVAGVMPISNFEGLLRFIDNAYTLADNVSLRRGRHSLKAGFEIRRLMSNRIQKQNPVYTFNSINDFLNNVPNTVRIILGQPGAELRQWQTGIFFQDDFQVHPRLMLNLGLRWEYYTPVAEAKGRLFNVVGDPFGPFRPAGAQIYDKDLNNFNPRAGLAWDVTGRQQTVVRAGFGVYSSPLAPIFIWDTPTIDPRQPFAFNATPADIPGLAFPLTGSLAQAVSNPDTALQLGLLPSVVGRRIIDPHLRDTYSDQWNFSLQQQLGQKFSVQAAYVGNLQLKAVNTRSVNLIDPVTKRRPDPTSGEILMIEDSGRRSYNSLQFSAHARVIHGLTTDAYYTWGHSLVYGGDDCCTGSNDVVQDQENNIAGSRGPANNDVRHQFTWAYAYDLPGSWARGSGWDRLVDGWSLQGIVRARTGFPVNIVSGRDVRGNGLAGPQRPNYVGGSIYASNQSIQQWFNKDAFALPPAGQYGNLGKNIATGPGFASWDFSVIKNTRIAEKHFLQFRAEFFNFLNHTNFGNPNQATAVGVTTSATSAPLVAPNFGQILAAREPRQVQLSLRYQF